MAGLNSLHEMLEEMEGASDLVRPSSFWEQINGINLDQVSTTGFDEFKRTVNSNYFQWLPTGPRDPQFRAVLKDWLRNPSLEPFHARLVDSGAYADTRFGPWLNRRSARLGYAVYVAMLWDAVHGRVPSGLLERLEEPAVGNPLLVEHRGRLVTQDLCNSVLEYSTIKAAAPLPESGRVVEVGAGYGRLAWVFLEEMPDIRYLVVDIPPALAIAEEYLSALFPNRNLFPFRRFRRFEDVAHEFESANVAFMTPTQLDLLPPLGADLLINVSSFHEMHPDQIGHFFTLIDEHCAGFFYSKQWLAWRNPVDGVDIGESSYPLRSHLRSIFKRRHPIQRGFFEALYDVDPTA
ncbi:MAG TPA: putative sugar O-methyltransferase [Acidimicrobiia bacterium]|nr:putative sugar O-methyltransferase [Acidimicrobiia bacterium]